MSASESVRESAVEETEQVELPPVDVIDAMLFPIFALAFALSLAIFDPLQRLAILFGIRAQQWVVVWLNRCLKGSLYFAGTRFEIEGADELPADRPYILVSNHQALFDIPILHCAFHRHRPRFIAKQELGKWLPSVSFNLRRGGSALIDRSNPRQALPEIKKLGIRMTEGKFAAVIFPEGTRARTGALKPFRHAGVSTLIQSAPEAGIIPVVLDNSWKLSCRKFGPIPRGTVVRMRILSELDRTGRSAKELVEDAEKVIRKALEEMRGEAASK